MTINTSTLSIPFNYYREAQKEKPTEELKLSKLLPNLEDRILLQRLLRGIAVPGYSITKPLPPPGYKVIPRERGIEYDTYTKKFQARQAERNRAHHIFNELAAKSEDSLLLGTFPLQNGSEEELIRKKQDIAGKYIELARMYFRELEIKIELIRLLMSEKSENSETSKHLVKDTANDIVLQFKAGLRKNVEILAKLINELRKNQIKL